MARQSKPFRDRNPVTIGAISLAVIAALVVLAFNAESLPFIGGGTVYQARFSEAAGLQPDDPVRVAGVKVGQVEKLSLEQGAVLVEFRVKDTFLGNRSALGETVHKLAPFVRVFTNTLGNGRWFDSFVENLFPGVLGSMVCGGAAQTPLPVGCSTGGN